MQVIRMSKRQLAVALCFGVATTVSGVNSFAQSTPEEGPKAAASESDLTPERKAEYERHLASGKAAYNSQDFDTAYRELSTAHSIFAKPAILFNLALISERGGALEQAKTHYETFLEAPGVTLEDRQRASVRLKAIKEILATSSDAERTKAQEEQANLIPALEAMGIDDIEDIPADKKASETPDSTAESASTSDTSMEDNTPYTWPVIAAYTTAGLALAGGAGMIFLSMDAVDEGKAAGSEGDLDGLASAEEKASTYSTAATGLIAGGVVMAVVGTVYAVMNGGESDPVDTAPSNDTNVSFSWTKEFTGPVFSTKF